MNYLAGLAVGLISKIGPETTRKKLLYARTYGMGNRKLLRLALGLRP